MRLLIALHVIWFDFTIVAELQAAMDNRDVESLRAAICKVENSHVISSFTSEEVEAAKRLLRHLEIIAELQAAMDSRDVKGLRAAIPQNGKLTLYLLLHVGGSRSCKTSAKTS